MSGINNLSQWVATLIFMNDYGEMKIASQMYIVMLEQHVYVVVESTGENLNVY